MTHIQKVELLQFSTKGDDRGKLIALEGLSKDVPFDIKRMYYIFDTTLGAVRGHHAHKELKQVLICVSGSCTIVCDDLIDDKRGGPVNPCLVFGVVDYCYMADASAIHSNSYGEGYI